MSNFFGLFFVISSRATTSKRKEFDMKNNKGFHGWEKYGEKLASKLRGMFAFLLWDKKRRIFYGARVIFQIIR